MKHFLLFKIAVVTVGTLWGLWRVFRVCLMREGFIVDGEITYVEGKPGQGGTPLLTFSYSGNGQRFHRNWSETLDGGSSTRLHAAVARYERGDKIQVWYAKADPEVFCIAPRPSSGEVFKRGAVRLLGDAVEGIGSGG